MELKSAPEIGTDTGPDRVVGRSIALIALIAVVQLGLTAGVILIPMAAQVRSTWGQPALERSARIAFGDEFADYVMWVRDQTPETSLLLLPRMEQEPAFGNQGLMLFYFYPRSTTNCPARSEIADCLEQAAGPRTYVIRLGDFPTQEKITVDGMEYVAMDDSRGLYKPSPSDGSMP